MERETWSHYFLHVNRGEASELKNNLQCTKWLLRCSINAHYYWLSQYYCLANWIGFPQFEHDYSKYSLVCASYRQHIMALAFSGAFGSTACVSTQEDRPVRSRCLQAPETLGTRPLLLNPSRFRRSVLHLPRMSGDDRRARVLMVCLGNICRSPAAEAVMRAVIARRGLGSVVAVDSCGTGGDSPNWYKPGGFSYHEGDPADSRMRAAAKTRGYDVTSISRPLRVSDFAEFDLILGMDASNLEAIDTARRAWGVGSPGSDGVARVALFSTFSPSKQFRGRPVPDPYYGGKQGFEHVLDLIEDTCEGILSDSVIARKIEAA